MSDTKKSRKRSSREGYRALRHLCVTGIVLCTLSTLEGIVPKMFLVKPLPEIAPDLSLTWLLPTAALGLIVSWFLRRRRLLYWQWTLAILSAAQAGYWALQAAQGEVSIALATISVWVGVITIQCFTAANQRAYQVLQGISFSLLIVAGWQHTAELYPQLLAISLVLLLFSCLAARASPIGVADVYVDNQFPGVERTVGVGVLIVLLIGALAWPIYKYLPRPTPEQHKKIAAILPLRTEPISEFHDAKQRRNLNQAQFLIGTPRLSLATFTPPKHTGKIIFMVDGAAHVSWRGVILDSYTGRSWISRPRRKWRYLRSLKKAKDKTIFLSRQDGAWRRTAALKTYRVQVIGASIKYLLRPPGAVEAKVGTYHLMRDGKGNVIASPRFLSPFSYTIKVPKIHLPRRRNPPVPARYLRVPRSSKRVRKLVRTLAREGSDDRSRAIAFVNYLRAHCRYKLEAYNVPRNQDVLDYFLFTKKRGWCIHFASALAVMCRLAKIPARVITGFGPGKYDPEIGKTIIRDRDAHAWVEVCLNGGEWEALDATPASESPLVIQKPRLPVSRKMTALKRIITATKKDLENSYQVANVLIQRQPLWLLLPTGALGLLVWGWRRRRTHARRQRTTEHWKEIYHGTPRAAARAAYLLAAEHLMGNGYGPLRRTTPEEYLQRLQAEGSEAADALAQIIATYETSAFGPHVTLNWDREGLAEYCEQVLTTKRQGRFLFRRQPRVITEIRSKRR